MRAVLNLYAYHIPSTIFKTGDTAENKIKAPDLMGFT